MTFYLHYFAVYVSNCLCRYLLQCLFGQYCQLLLLPSPQNLTIAQSIWLKVHLNESRRECCPDSLAALEYSSKFWIWPKLHSNQNYSVFRFFSALSFERVFELAGAIWLFIASSIHFVFSFHYLSFMVLVINQCHELILEEMSDYLITKCSVLQYPLLNFLVLKYGVFGFFSSPNYAKI